jgi:hypothetical protein
MVAPEPIALALNRTGTRDTFRDRDVAYTFVFSQDVHDVSRMLREYLDPALTVLAIAHVDELGILDRNEGEAAIAAYIA